MNKKPLTLQQYEALLEQYYRPMMRYAWQLYPKRDEAEDMVQNAFVKLWKARESVQFNKAAGWLKVVIRNQIIDHIRSKAPMNRLDDDEEHYLQMAASPSSEPEFIFTKNQEYLMLGKAFAQLKDRERLALGLFYVDGLKIKQIAAHLLLSENAAESLIRRARAKLKWIMEEMA